MFCGLTLLLICKEKKYSLIMNEYTKAKFDTSSLGRTSGKYNEEQCFNLISSTTP